MKYASIIIDIVNEKLDRIFEYAIPKLWEEKAVVGASVVIPFGNSNRKINGFIIDIISEPQYDKDKIKEIIEVSESKTVLEGQLISLACWMKEKYGCTMIQALKVVLPVKNKVKHLSEKTLSLNLDDLRAKAVLAEYHRKKYKAKERLLNSLIERKSMKVSEAKNMLNISAQTVQAMLSEGVIVCEEERIFRNPVEDNNTFTVKKLNDEQQFVLDTVLNDFDKNIRRNYLIHGVTGSGKTEVYIKIIEYIINKGMQAIVLIPEIALTYQTVSRFTGYFGDKVSVLHSRLSAGEKYDQMQRAKSGEVQIMIGPRSALFTPFTNLGVIIIDEEHESSYKSEVTPKYHARETALKRASLCGASVILGSATPSIETYYWAKCGVYKLLELKGRAFEQEMPKVYVEDLRKELREGNRSIFSRRLKMLINEKLKKNEQIMLFLNRRGYAGFVSCRSCGHVMKCPHCDVSLSQHTNGRLICHYCGYQISDINKCPQCGSKYIMGFKAGTQQIESLVNKEFPNARVLRMDMDTTKGKKGHEQIVKSFANREADILIGTQMIVKGHDFKNVTLVGILAADLSLNSASYMGSERTFQLLVQAAGRAGRGSLPGEVVFQTYNPEHYCIQCAADQDYEQFYEKEMKYRKIMNYPPAGNMMEFYVISESEELLLKVVSYIKLQLEAADIDNLRIVGPAPAVIYKLQDMYRQVFYFKSEDEELLIKVREYLERVTLHFMDKYKCDFGVQFDFC